MVEWEEDEERNAFDIFTYRKWPIKRLIGHLR